MRVPRRRNTSTISPLKAGTQLREEESEKWRKHRQTFFQTPPTAKPRSQRRRPRQLALRNDGHVNNPKNCTWTVESLRFLHSLNCGHPSRLHNTKFAHSEDEMNLRHLQFEPLGLLELVADGHRDVERRNLDGLLRSLPLFLDPLHNPEAVKGRQISQSEGTARTTLTVSMICSTNAVEPVLEDNEHLHPHRLSLHRSVATPPQPPSCPGTHNWGSWAPPCT